MPPSGFNKRCVNGILVFVRECYIDLLQEVEEGKHADFKSAIEYEVTQIGKVLEDVHINSSGQLVKR